MLPVAVLALLASPRILPPTPEEPMVVTLYRGGAGNYQAVTDTYIESASPDENHGGETILGAGPGKTVLIRFGDLGTYLPANRKVTAAELVLGNPDGNAAELSSITSLHSQWGEGPFLTLSSFIGRPTKPDPKAPRPAASRGSATWRQRRAGEATGNWRESGTGSGDGIRLESARIEKRPDGIAFLHLEAAVQEMVDHPETNGGFAIRLAQPIDFPSSQAATRRPRLVITLGPENEPTRGPDLSVTRIEKVASGTSDALYTAHIKNVGDAPSPGFTSTWSVGERAGASSDTLREIKAGEEVNVTLTRSAKVDKGDHRFQSIGLAIEPKGGDQNPRNNSLEIQEGARRINVVVTKALAAAVEQSLNSRGSKSVEDWVQAQFGRMNEVYLDRSRFSFAPEGARERVALQQVVVADGPVEVTDGLATVFLGGNPALRETALLQQIGRALGLLPVGCYAISKENNPQVGRASFDRYPGLMGYGDTRYDGAISGLTPLPYTPQWNPVFDANPLEPSGLLSATDVAILNQRLDETIAADALPSLPRALLLKATDLTGRPLPGAQLSFYQSNGGAIPAGEPLFTLKAGSSGTTFLPNRDENGVFGKLDPNGNNHTFLIRAVANGVTEWGWLKAWQAIDTASRGSKSAAILEARFDLPSTELDPDSDLAKERIVSDSKQTLPSQLSALVDGDLSTSVSLADKPGDWVEIDLGRDRTIAEVSLVLGNAPFWSQFEIRAYATGQGPDDNSPWAYETDLAWTRELRTSGPDAKGLTTLTYRGQSRRFRYLRLINRATGPGVLHEIKLGAVKVVQ